MTQTEIPDTPLMNQYYNLKKKHNDSILFFRLGDFYEMFDEDAKKASSILSLTLTSRQNVPMCGIPYHSSTTYISRLINAGYNVAICEQIGQEDKKTKLFKREVIRVITPGTIIEDDLLDKKTHNYLMTLVCDIIGWGISYCDISTGEFKSSEHLNDPNFYHLSGLISRIRPSEIVVDPNTASILKKNNFKFPAIKITEHFCDYKTEFVDISSKLIQKHRLAFKSAQLAYSYISKTQASVKLNLEPAYFEDENTMQLDETAIKTLELIDADYEGGKSLFDILDFCKTSMGSRLLKRWLLNPLIDIYTIKQRQEVVNFLYNSNETREKLGEILDNIGDIERISGRIVNYSINPRDAIAIKNAISYLPALKVLLSNDEFFKYASDIANRLNAINGLIQLKETIENSINHEPPIKISDGNVIKEGFNKELDELRDLKKNSQKIISEMELSERQKTGINSLKIGYNTNFGYYIEITKSNLSRVPSYYQRRQTLTNAERFITNDLKELEDKIINAQEKILKLENVIFNEIKENIYNLLPYIREYAICIAILDVYLSLSQAAIKNDYVRPEILTDSIIEIKDGRHPVVERNLLSGNFVPNDFSIGNKDPQIIILTGPNMSGKSVYLRQNALIVIMAQIGSFVPASAAKISIVDRIMTRIGAHDRLSRGESTFMVEMKETAEILKNATEKTLVLLDEIGRGTSTYDGISLAWAITEYLYKKGPKVIFATHYFELTDLAFKFDGIKNFNILVKEWIDSKGKREVIFMHKIVPGPADKSYGIHVAQLAGLPQETIIRAKEILNELENSYKIDAKSKSEQELLPIFEQNPVLEKIKNLDLNSITPIEALNILNELKEKS